MKKVLIISKAFYPEISPRSFRTTQLANELVQQGCDVTVMLPNLNEDYYLEYTKEHKIKFLNIGYTSFDKFTNQSLIARIIRRILQLSTEFPTVELSFLLKKALKKMSDYDMLISIAVPHPIHWGVAMALKNNKSFSGIWVADCGDPFMGCKTDFYKKFFYFKYIEKNWCKRCNYISIPTESSVDGYYPEFQHKIRIIPQGFNFDEIKIPRFTKNAIPTFAYAGALTLHFRNPCPLLDYLLTLDFDFKFVIFTESDIIQPYIEKFKGKLELRSYIPRHELLTFLGSMDFLVNFENNTSVQTPSKLIDYSIVNRPVISINKEFNTNIVDEFLDGNYTNRYKMPDLSKYDIKNVAAEFLSLCVK